MSANTTYYYRVRAYNIGGTSSSSNIITVTTLSNPSSVPAGLTVSSCNDLVTLNWSKSTGSDFLRYRIYGGTTNNPITKIDSTTNGISDISKIISGLKRGNTYNFRVTAVNSDGVESGFSNQSTATVKSGAVPKIRAKWSDVLICSNLGDSITSFQWYKAGSAISEVQNVGSLSIPFYINLRLPFNETIGFFLQPGVTLTVPLSKNYKSSGTFTYKGYYPADNVLFENLPAYGFPSNKSIETDGELELKPFGFNVTASAGFDFFIKNNILIAVAACYDKSLSSISNYSSPDKFQLSSDPEQINSLMEGSSKATIQSMGLKLIFRYYLK